MAPNSVNSPLDRVERHHEYYIPGGDLFLLVDNTFFCVHSYFFIRDSGKFKQEITAPPEAGKPQKGSSESSAIHIRDATPDEFAKFLWVFYNKSFSTYRATVPEWTSILKIACSHDFPGVKDFAVQGLECCDMPIANRIKLYQQYDVGPRYINPLFVKFCLREDGPTDEETEIMGTKVSLIVYRARERLRTHATPQSGGKAPSFAESDALEAISSILGYNAPSKGLDQPSGANGSLSCDKKKSGKFSDTPKNARVAVGNGDLPAKASKSSRE